MVGYLSIGKFLHSEALMLTFNKLIVLGEGNFNYW